jgi:hypothetical protein
VAWPGLGFGFFFVCFVYSSKAFHFGQKKKKGHVTVGERERNNIGVWISFRAYNYLATSL